MTTSRLWRGAAALTVAAFACCLAPTTSARADTRSAVAAAADPHFERVARYPVFHNVPEGVDPADPTVAEISTVSDDGNTLIYTDALGQRVGFVDISDADAPQGLGTVDLSTLGHADDQPTSVIAHGEHVLVVIDETGGDFTAPAGRVDVLDLKTRAKVASLDLAGQPDSIAISPDGRYAAIAIENQRDEEATPEGGDEGDLPQAPAGFVQVIELAGQPRDWVPVPVPLTQADGSALPTFVAAGITAPTDPEPEYVTINAANQVAVTLQENNGVVLIDLPTATITRVFSAGSVTLDGVDASSDGRISPIETLSAVPREPDSISWLDDRYLATANEGDWNGGSRGWSVFDSTTGVVAWDAGASFDDLMIRHGLYNDGRASKKGSEPEGLAHATFQGVPLVFVASERSNALAVYDVSDPVSPRFTQLLFTDAGPEGILPIPGRDLVAVSSETDEAEAGLRSSVTLYRLGSGAAGNPSLISADVQGKPLGWQAMSGLSGDEQGNLWAVSDDALAPSTVYQIDHSRTPAVITSALPVTTSDGAEATLDLEGIAARAGEGAGFWLAAEGKTGAENRLVRVNPAGVVQESVALPDEVAAGLGKWGLEGVTVTGAGDDEQVYVALQRPLMRNVADNTDPVDGDDTVRIGRYTPATQQWTWFAYRLDHAATGWQGLSEITALSDYVLAVIERDNQVGERATHKRVYTVDLAQVSGVQVGTGGFSFPVPLAASVDDLTPSGLPVLTKTLAFDALPLLQATHGTTQEKLEGLGVTAGQVFIVTDNDALNDAVGETVFARVGAAEDVFAAALAAPRDVPGSDPSTVPGDVGDVPTEAPASPAPSADSAPAGPAPSADSAGPAPAGPGLAHPAPAASGPAAQPVAAPRELAATGVQPAPYLYLAAALLALGGIFWAQGRRRSR